MGGQKRNAEQRLVVHLRQFLSLKTDYMRTTLSGIRKSAQHLCADKFKERFGTC
ncbi:hypothetical cytosolic protein [Syntrophus aciditrophicus SB]|uniref:Hypothetical cytosolic protein n=1 Tax=Syntrophus aciditrophicus (strain SB) TaxID=56780 RepID=Q2LPP1_SYNAS|nr:hypothetical cytosolic protein [Syntrophus aciditrophicus SB]